MGIDLSVMNMTYQDFDFEPNGTYTYTVYAFNDVGKGPIASVTFTTPEEKEEPPRTAPPPCKRDLLCPRGEEKGDRD